MRKYHINSIPNQQVSLATDITLKIYDIDKSYLYERNNFLIDNTLIFNDNFLFYNYIFKLYVKKINPVANVRNINSFINRF